MVIDYRQLNSVTIKDRWPTPRVQSHLDFLKEIATACDFMAANFESRMANRAEEVDGLNQAKATFSGAKFD